MARPTPDGSDPHLYAALSIRSLAAPCPPPCPPDGEVPFGVRPEISETGLKARREFAAAALRQVTALLDLLQGAHRKGLLSAEEHVDLGRLQVWYTRLTLEREAAGLPPPKPRRDR